jgi:hypothetical protein
LLLIGQQGWAISSGIGPCFQWLEDCANFTPTPAENDQYSASQPLLENTRIVSSRNDKNKQLTFKTLLGQHINRKKYVNGSVNSEGYIKMLKNRRDASSSLYLSMYVPVCHQKPNSARETVPLMNVITSVVEP